MGGIVSRCMHKCIKSNSVQNKPVPVSNSSSAVTTINLLQQPELDATKWLLTDDELTCSRQNVWRSELQCISDKNHVTTFASSDAFFTAVFADMEATHGAQDVIWLTGWSLNKDVPLVPTHAKPIETSLHQIVERAVCTRGVHVRALVWANLLERRENLATRDWMNSLVPDGDNKAIKGSCIFLFDNRLPHRTSSHHQKTIIIKRDNTLIAYIGGLDITKDRWDTLDHNRQAFRAELGIERDTKGWIDGAMRIHGPAAKDVAANFISRWNSAPFPYQTVDDILDFENLPLVDNVPLIHRDPQLQFPFDGKSTVQIVRTFSPHCREEYPEYAPKGELSLLDARVKAIRQARNFIYIEDQYFFSMPQLLDALLEVLPRIQLVIVIVQRPTVTREAKIAVYEKLVCEMAHPLITKFPSKFRIYTTKKALGLYIHSKILLIDDVYLSIGSANWNRRSMTSDSEIAANLMDSQPIATPQDNGITVSRLIRDFRLQKITEKVKISTEELDKMTLLESFGCLDKAITDPNTILALLNVDEKWRYNLVPEEYSIHVVDPDDLNEEH